MYSRFNDRVEAVGTHLSEHRRRATEVRQTEQHPESVVVVDSECTVCSMREIDSQTARVDRLTVGFKKCYQ